VRSYYQQISLKLRSSSLTLRDGRSALIYLGYCALASAAIRHQAGTQGVNTKHDASERERVRPPGIPGLCGEPRGAPEIAVTRHCASTLALTASQSSSNDKVSLHRREPLVRLFLVLEHFDRCRPDGSHVTTAAPALLALAALPPLLADAFAAAVFAPSVTLCAPAALADAFAATFLAVSALPAVLDAHLASLVFQGYMHTVVVLICIMLCA
jgi:hypothetical protein